jgi:transposase
MRQARRGREAGLQLDMVEGPTLRPRSVAHALFSLRVALRSITRRVLGRLFDGPWSRCSTPKDNPDANQHHASADQDYAEIRKLEARRAMKLCAALDTSSSRTAICVVNSRDGSIVYEASVATDPAIIFGALAPFLPRLESVGHEAGSVSPWLHRELTSLGLPMVLLETRHAAAALDAQRNKTDKNDARGLAHLVRTGWFRAVHVKSDESQKLRLVLGHRRTLKRKLLDIENEIRHSLKVFGLMVGPRAQRASFEARVRELVARDALIAGVTECMLRAWAALWAECKLHQLNCPPCRRR